MNASLLGRHVLNYAAAIIALIAVTMWIFLKGRESQQRARISSLLIQSMDPTENIATVKKLNVKKNIVNVLISGKNARNFVNVRIALMAHAHSTVIDYFGIV